VRSFKLEDYSELLAAIESPDLDLILVGGHAVSVYGYDYHRSCPALDAYLPFLSKDADLIGTVASGMQLASRLNAQWKKESTKGGLRGLSIEHIELPNVPGAKVEILGQILGVKTEDIRNTVSLSRFVVINLRSLIHSYFTKPKPRTLFKLIRSKKAAPAATEVNWALWESL
jgi:hypothetical protein